MLFALAIGKRLIWNVKKKNNIKNLYIKWIFIVIDVDYDKHLQPFTIFLQLYFSHVLSEQLKKTKLA